MAEECSSTTPSSWWEYYNYKHMSTTPWHNTENPKSSCEEDHVSINTSFTNIVSNRPGLTGEFSPRLADHDHQHAPFYKVIQEHEPDNNLWTNVLIQDVKESYYDDVFSSRSTLSCDYLKKMDSSNTWELNNFDNQFNLGGYVGNNNFVDGEEGERLADNKFSSFVDNTSVNELQPRLMSLHADVSNMKLMFNDLTLCPIPMKKISSLNNLCYVDQDNVNININHHKKPYDYSANIGNNGLFGHVISNKYDHGVSGSSCANIGRNFDNQHGVFSSSKLSKPCVEFHASSSKIYMKSSSLSDSKKQRPRVTSSSSSVNENGRGPEGKKKRFEDDDYSHTVTKKPKLENPTISCVKMQGPKMKLNEKIAALQQIVAPFGKTDTASVLLEAIGHIKCLQDHIKTLLSNPYLKVNATKFQEAWGHMERKFDRGDLKVDLKNRGLCLVPIACIPQIYRDSTGSDYWTPTYRGCLYR